MREPYAAITGAVAPARPVLDTLVGVALSVTFGLSVLVLLLSAEPPSQRAPASWPATVNALRCGGGR